MIPILIFAGTRPEIIKTAPVIQALRNSAKLAPVFCFSGQHQDLAQPFFSALNIKPDLALAVMRPGQSLADLSAALFAAIPPVLREVKPGLVLVQGDTSTVAVAAQCAFTENIPIGHIEAGLRTYNLRAPFPEEFNRRVVSLLADLHFAPTALAAQNLLAEKTPPNRVHITGNTVVDALRHMLAHLKHTPPKLPRELAGLERFAKGFVLITGHRRENFNGGLERVCRAIARLAKAHPDIAFVYAVHPNPNVRRTVQDTLSGQGNVLLLPPLGYAQCIQLMRDCLFMISDSGGIQEEAASMQKNVLVTRETTERPEAVEAGWCILVGSDQELIIDSAERLLVPGAAAKPAHAAGDIYGDGHAGEKIALIIEDFLKPRR